MREHEEILLGGMFRPSEQNCPTREGELIESLDKIYDIPNPRVGMRVYVENTGKEYIVKSLKEKTIGGVTVPDAMVEILEEAVSESVLGDVAGGLANQFSNIERNIKANALQYNKIGFNVYEDRVQLYAKNISDNDVRLDDIPAATPERAGVMSAKDKRKLDAAGSGATKIVWDSSSNMNDFKTAGVYDIYGERTRQDDNLPILNASPGHSIAARLTVVASTLQPANNEICVTQFLQLSNRVGGDGATYIRTYNENNNGMNGWSPWQKQMGMVETQLNSLYYTGYPIGPGQGDPTSTRLNVVGNGLNGMIDNGIYSGIYTDGIYFGSAWGEVVFDSRAMTFLETFVLIVINDYAISGQAGLPRHITQLKYAVDAITNQATVKQRTKTDGGDWTDWQDISGGGSSEVDITDAVKAYGLPTLIAQGFAKEGVTYKVLDFGENAPVVFDSENKIFNKLMSSGINGIEGHWDAYVKNYNNYITIHACGYMEGNKPNVLLYQFILRKDLKTIKVSADMTTL